VFLCHLSKWSSWIGGSPETGTRPTSGAPNNHPSPIGPVAKARLSATHVQSGSPVSLPNTPVVRFITCSHSLPVLLTMLLIYTEWHLQVGLFWIRIHLSGVAGLLNSSTPDPSHSNLKSYALPHPMLHPFCHQTLALPHPLLRHN
jgi:hypothetical protein